MDAIILAGGRGTRLKDVISEVPKPLAPICGVPFLDILLERIDQCPEIRRLVLAVGYLGDKIVARYGGCRCFHSDIQFSMETRLLGTGGAVRKALALTESEEVLVQNGDTFIELDYGELISDHRRRSADLTMVLTRVEDPGRYGSVNLDEDQRILSFNEKEADSDSTLINAGVYIIRRELFHHIPEGQVLSLERDLLPSMVRCRAYGFQSDGRFIDIGIPKTYQQAQDTLKEAASWQKKKSS
jgi:D-glycero-alpha-D-manno-heptose 1-phosphate guanylyltransferase